MQAVSASCAGVASVPARAPRHPRPRGRRATRNREPLDLTSWEDDRLNNKIYRVVCSEPWYRHCKALIQSGAVAYKDDQAKELRRAGVYPPGGVGTRMEHCSLCGHWCPPARYARDEWVTRDETTGQVTRHESDWRPVCNDCQVGDMHLFDMVRLPSSKPIERPVADREFAGHLEGSGWQRRSKRRRFVGAGGVLQETVVTDDGEVFDLVVLVPPPPGQGEGGGEGSNSAETGA